VPLLESRCTTSLASVRTAVVEAGVLVSPKPRAVRARPRVRSPAPRSPALNAAYHRPPILSQPARVLQPAPASVRRFSSLDEGRRSAPAVGCRPCPGSPSRACGRAASARSRARACVGRPGRRRRRSRGRPRRRRASVTDNSATNEHRGTRHQRSLDLHLCRRHIRAAERPSRSSYRNPVGASAACALYFLIQSVLTDSPTSRCAELGSRR
jgi:hypothetical protein